MTILHMRLTERDTKNIKFLKDKYQLTQTSELIRFLLVWKIQDIKKEND